MKIAVQEAPEGITLRETTARAREIYRTVMRFLEGKYQSNTGALQDLLEVPVAAGATLKFRKVITMGQSMTASYAQSVDREDLKIHYDPNWEAIDKLVELLFSSSLSVQHEAKT